MKRLTILGSTGSIGQSTLKVVRHLGPEKVRIAALAAKSNTDLLIQQALEFQPEVVAIFDKDKVSTLKKSLPNIQVLAGMEGLQEAATHPNANMVVSAISGTMGLRPTASAIQAGKAIGLANKEALISGGAFITSFAQKHGVPLIPIDSEHSAIFQCLQGEKTSAIRRLILTASGGPFRSFSDQELENITVETALNHPTWRMGPKVTIDCSTLMNKGLEMIEAHWLFGVPPSNIEVVIHPQSIIHSMVEFTDTSILAQMSYPDMVMPIQYAITYPERMASFLKPYDFSQQHTLQFFPPDTEKFRCLKLAYFALEQGKSLPCYMNAANEVLVHRFLNKEIPWKAIPQKLETLMQQHSPTNPASLEEILEIDALARGEAQKQ